MTTGSCLLSVRAAAEAAGDKKRIAGINTLRVYLYARKVWAIKKKGRNYENL